MEASKTAWWNLVGRDLKEIGKGCIDHGQGNPLENEVLCFDEEKE